MELVTEYMKGNINLTLALKSQLILTQFMCSFSIDHYAASRKVAGSIPDEVIGFFFFLIYLILPAALWFSQPLKETSSMNLPVDKERQARKVHNFTAICEAIFEKTCIQYFFLLVYPHM
jgi:hypothetical protein